MSELQLRQDVLDELEFEPSVDAAHIGVAVEKGLEQRPVGRRLASGRRRPPRPPLVTRGSTPAAGR